MSFTLNIVCSSAMGAIGGLINCTLAGGFLLPHHDKKAKIWRPGWIGDVFLSVVAADLVCGFHNPAPFYEFASQVPAETHLIVAQALNSLFVGISGARILKGESRKPLLEQGRDERF